MCGIAGKLYFDGTRQVSEEELRRFHEAIVHRGPDDHGIYINPSGNVGLVHRRLSIIDLSPAGHQPMTNEDGTVWITFNGEIYNFQELRQKLEKKGHPFKSHTDTETILHLWEEYGEKCVEHLRGMFAFAIWDDRKKKLFLARDRAGKKPLKYFINDKMIVFGSELKSFLNDPDVPHEVDREAIHYYLTFQYIPHPLTGFKGIKKLPQAHTLCIDLSRGKPKIELRKYWKLDFSKTLTLREEEWEERILGKLKEAVTIRMMSDVPLGAFLSGGVDSSAVVSYMAESSSQPIKTFSIGFKEERFNELPYARRVAEQYKTDHKEFIVEPDCIEVLPKLIYHYEEPYADSSALPTYYLAKMTRQHVTVALNGDGGDENFAGYPWYGLMKQDHLYRKLPKGIRQANRFLLTALHRWLPSRLLRYGEVFVEGALRPESELHAELLSYFSKREKEALYDEPFKKETSSWPSYLLLEDYYKESGTQDPIHRALFTDVNTYLANDLNVKVDIASMANSLEARSPFLDHELMELVAQIPSSLKWRHGQGKYILKKALRKRLPHDLMYRRKQGFSVPIGRWFETSLYEYTRERLLEPNAFPPGMFNRRALEELTGSRERMGRESRRIWALLTLKLWWDQFLNAKRDRT